MTQERQPRRRENAEATKEKLGQRMRATIRPMRISDYPAAAELWANTEGMGLGAGDDRASIATCLRKNPGLSQVAFVGDRLIATAICSFDGRRAWMYHFAVARDCRSRGIGKAMERACCRALAGTGVAKCSILVFKTNESGRDFWASQGWLVRDNLTVMQKRFHPAGHRRQASKPKPPTPEP